MPKHSKSQYKKRRNSKRSTKPTKHSKRSTKPTKRKSTKRRNTKKKTMKGGNALTDFLGSLFSKKVIKKIDTLTDRLEESSTCSMNLSTNFKKLQETHSELEKKSKDIYKESIKKVDPITQDLKNLIEMIKGKRAEFDKYSPKKPQPQLGGAGENFAVLAKEYAKTAECASKLTITLEDVDKFTSELGEKVIATLDTALSTLTPQLEILQKLENEVKKHVQDDKKNTDFKIPVHISPEEEKERKAEFEAEKKEEEKKRKEMEQLRTDLYEEGAEGSDSNLYYGGGGKRSKKHTKKQKKHSNKKRRHSRKSKKSSRRRKRNSKKSSRRRKRKSKSSRKRKSKKSSRRNIRKSRKSRKSNKSSRRHKRKSNKGMSRKRKSKRNMNRNSKKTSEKKTHRGRKTHRRRKSSQ